MFSNEPHKSTTPSEQSCMYFYGFFFQKIQLKYYKQQSKLKMKKTIFTITSVLFSYLAYSQVGINTENPQQMFHVDGQMDNPNSGSPSTAQQINDVVITENGQIGVGTVTPSKKLEIYNGNTAGAIKIVDGTQGESKVLMSDAEGVGTWQTPASIRPTIIGTYPSPGRTVNSITSNKYVNTGTFISLPKGKWIVNAGITISYNFPNDQRWLHAYLSTSTGHTNSITNTGFYHLGPARGLTAFAGKISSGLNLLAGSSVIEVTADNVNIYLMIETLGQSEWTSASGSYENYLYAIPIN